MSKNKNTVEFPYFNCGCILFFFIFNLVFGGVTVQYVCESFIGKKPDFIVASICGLFLAELTVPLTLICWLLRSCGLETPFIH